MAEEEKRKKATVRNHSHGLQQVLSKLRDSSATAALTADATIGLVNQLQNNADGIKGYLADILGPEFTAGVATAASSAKARKVFGTNELLEMILLQLHPRQVLVAQRVNKSFEALILSSPKVLFHLGLRADPTSAFVTPFDSFDDGWSMIRVHVNTHQFYPPMALRQLELSPYEYEVSASIYHLSTPPNLPQLGDRCRSILICQPPIFQMEASVTCCNRDLHNWIPATAVTATGLDYPEPVRSTTGTTIGDLLDATKQLWARHRTCAHAQHLDHDREGFVMVQPRFHGPLRLKTGDPIMQTYQAHRKQFDEQSEHDLRMVAYVTAKQQGGRCVKRSSNCFDTC